MHLLRAAVVMALRLLARGDWPVISWRKPPPTDADEWRAVADKLHYLER